MKITLYGIPNCDTVKKARTWLNEHRLIYQFHDFKKLGITTTLLKDWLQVFPLESLINRKGTTWRKLSTDTQAFIKSVEDAMTVIQTHPSVIKRPVLAIHLPQQTPHLYLGFNPEQYQQIFYQ